MITSWSYSRLSTYEQCAFQAYLKFVERVPEPERPLPPGKTEHANDRGTRVHDNAEHFVRGTAELVPELVKHFSPEFQVLRSLYGAGKVSLEGEWGYDREWNPTDWRSAWLRLKIDAMVRVSPHYAVVIDYKTGKKFGNEIKHGEQVQLYSIATFLRYPDLEQIDTELWYTDQNELTTMSFTRQQALRFRDRFDRRANKMTQATEFPPNPNIFSCKWCPFGPSGTGHCTVGV